MRKIFRFMGIIIFVAIEIFSYYTLRPVNLESFFLTWAVIALIIFLNSFIKNFGSVGRGVSCAYLRISTVYDNDINSSWHKEKDFDSYSRIKTLGFFILKKILYFIFLAFNSIAYMETSNYINIFLK